MELQLQVVLHHTAGVAHLEPPPQVPGTSPSGGCAHLEPPPQVVLHHAVVLAASSVQAVADAQDGAEQGAAGLIAHPDRQLEGPQAEERPGQQAVTWSRGHRGHRGHTLLPSLVWCIDFIQEKLESKQCCCCFNTISQHHDHTVYWRGLKDSQFPFKNVHNYS